MTEVVWERLAPAPGARPEVSVVLPVYEGDAWLAAAIDSVLQQEQVSLELLVINDGSTDDSLNIIRAKAAKDGRIQFTSHANRGLVTALNEGLAKARGEFIARMDQDDLMQASRLRKQVQRMRADPRIGICATRLSVIDERHGGGSWLARFPFPTDDARLRAMMRFRCALVHPTVMFRRQVLLDTGLRYQVEHLHHEDYALFLALGEHCHYATVTEPLHVYRKHAEAITVKHATPQQVAVRQVRRRLLRDLGLEPSDADCALHERFCAWQLRDLADLRAASRWLARLRAANQRSGQLDPAALDWVIAEFTWRQLHRLASQGPAVLWVALRGRLLPPTRLANSLGARLVARALLRRG